MLKEILFNIEFYQTRYYEYFKSNKFDVCSEYDAFLLVLLQLRLLKKSKSRKPEKSIRPELQKKG